MSLFYEHCLMELCVLFENLPVRRQKCTVNHRKE